MLDFKLLLHLLDVPKFPNTKPALYDELYPDGLRMGTLYIGKQGSGKTTALARHLVDYFKTFPDRAGFFLDPSGSVTNDFLSIVLSEPREVRDALLRRIVYDEPGHPEWVMPLPEFHRAYESPMEKQISRVVQNIEKLEPDLITQTPIMGGLSIHIAPELFRVLTALTPHPDIDPDETWQITESKRLLITRATLRQAIALVEKKVPSAHWFFKHDFLGTDEKEQARRVHALVSVLDRLETPEVRARLGYHKPAWTPAEAIRKGQIVLFNGQRLNDEDKAKGYLFRQVYSIIIAQINKRTPHDPSDRDVALVLDETKQLLSLPSMATELSELSPQYRSRKLQFYVVLQNLAQLSEDLRPHIWSLGNIVCFSVFDHDDAYTLARQLFPYVPDMVKLEAKTTTQQNITEPAQGQYLLIANHIRAMQNRECVIRRQISESKAEKYMFWIKRTMDAKKNATFQELVDVKEAMLKARGVTLREALTEINNRKLGGPGPTQPEVAPKIK